MKRKRQTKHKSVYEYTSSSTRSKTKERNENDETIELAATPNTFEGAVEEPDSVGELSDDAHPDSQEFDAPSKDSSRGEQRGNAQSPPRRTSHREPKLPPTANAVDEEGEPRSSELEVRRLLRNKNIGSEDENSSSVDELVREQSPTINGQPKRRRKKERTPSPPRILPPHEHYFFQNRPGGNKTSSNTFSSVSLLTHDEYFEAMKKYRDPHQSEINFLHDMHRQSFDQWLFELEQGFNICLHGWGSKRKVMFQFAEHIANADNAPKIIVLNGFAAGLSIRDLFETLRAAVPLLKDHKIPANPSDAINAICSALSEEDKNPQPQHPRIKYLIVINSLDAPALRRQPTQPLLARLAIQRGVSLVTSCDTSNFALLWDSSLRSHFNWVFHDATTFASFDVEISGGVSAFEEDGGVAVGGGVIDEVNALLGRSGRKVHGREGVAFVLRSLTESARRLYGLLVAEVMSVDEDQGLDGLDHEQDELQNGEAATSSKRKSKGVPSIPSNGSGVGIEYRSLYRKAVQSLIATSEMQFRQLLKEFYDHEMLTSRRDTMGTELLSLPFRRDELETILEEVEIDG